MFSREYRYRMEFGCCCTRVGFPSLFFPSALSIFFLGMLRMSFGKDQKSTHHDHSRKIFTAKFHPEVSVFWDIVVYFCTYLVAGGGKL